MVVEKGASGDNTEVFKKEKQDIKKGDRLNAGSKRTVEKRKTERTVIYR
jgi:hypothetical protein